MPTPRRCIVDEDTVGTYHCISRCVRGAMLCGEGKEHRRGWIEDRMAELQSAMAIDATAWCVLSNHMHLVVTTRPDLVRSWSDREVALRYLRMCPGRWKRKRKGIPVDGPPTEEEIEEILETPGRLGVIRKRLSSLSWFMAKLKESVARRANLEDGCRGHFWEQRFRSIRILDRTGLLATTTYVDLNAVRAGMVDRPEDTPNGSIAERIRMLLGMPQRTRIRLEPAPFDDEAGYVAHVDAWGRTLRRDKHAIPPELPPVLERLGLGRQRWLDLLRRGWDELRGTVLGTPESRRQEATRRGGRWVIDLTAR